MLSSFLHIRLDPDATTEINSDIHRLVEVKANELSASKHCPKPLRVQVKDVLLDRAQGISLWVGISANEMRRYSLSEVEDPLE